MPIRRTPSNCAFRDHHDPAQEARCALLRGWLGRSDPHDRVTPSVCQVCCQQAEPAENQLNPVLGSELFRATRAILDAGGTPACPLEKADQLHRWAFEHLPTLNLSQNAVAANPKTRCFHLGETTGSWRECTTCSGSVRLKVFACGHETRTTTTRQECHRCPDYEHALETTTGQVRRWAVGVTAAPRRDATLKRTLVSLEQAGWKKPYIFVEPGTRLPLFYPRARVTRRAQNALGDWSNWYATLVELLLRHPNADAYFISEDDVLYTRHLRDYLETSLWPAEKLGVVSLYTAMHQDRGDVNGYFPTRHGRNTWGSLAYIFPRAAAKALIRNARVLNHRFQNGPEANIGRDAIVGQFCLDTGLPYYIHTPSLAQHIGETSAIWDTSSAEGRRRAASFPGEHFDARSLLPRP